MKRIQEIDKNFAVAQTVEKDDMVFCNAAEKPFRVYGVFRENGKYRRMPAETARAVSEGVYELHANTAGGRVRFRTDSPYIAIHAEMENVCKMPHFALTGSAGFDLYVGNRYTKTFVPPIDTESGYESIAEFDGTVMRDITIYFPLYSDVKELYIGVQREAALEEATPYRNEKPVVYYGSSITQGGCASRPGMSYQSILSRAHQCDYVNLGFSGNAKAEDEMIAYIKNLEMAAFVYDYDHNAPSVEHLQSTHEKMFLAVRRAQPQLPIMILSRPKAVLSAEERERRAVIETTYRNALEAGDKNVYFLDGGKLTAFCGNEGTVDGCHPTDYGFASMAKALEQVTEFWYKAVGNENKIQ